MGSGFLVVIDQMVRARVRRVGATGLHEPLQDRAHGRMVASVFLEQDRSATSGSGHMVKGGREAPRLALGKLTACVRIDLTSPSLAYGG